MANNFFLTQLRWKRIPIRRMCFQQDGVTAQTARASMDIIRPLFPCLLISRFGNIHWPFRSPNLSMCDYLLWGHLKVRVYEHKPHAMEELKEAICEVVVQIDWAMTEKVFANFQERLQKCITDIEHHTVDVFSTLDFVKCYVNTNSNLWISFVRKPNHIFPLQIIKKRLICSIHQKNNLFTELGYTIPGVGNCFGLWAALQSWRLAEGHTY